MHLLSTVLCFLRFRSYYHHSIILLFPSSGTPCASGIPCVAPLTNSPSTVISSASPSKSPTVSTAPSRTPVFSPSAVPVSAAPMAGNLSRRNDVTLVVVTCVCQFCMPSNSLRWPLLSLLILLFCYYCIFTSNYFIKFMLCSVSSSAAAVSSASTSGSSSIMYRYIISMI